MFSCVFLYSQLLMPALLFLFIYFLMQINIKPQQLKIAHFQIVKEPFGSYNLLNLLVHSEWLTAFQRRYTQEPKSGIPFSSSIAAMFKDVASLVIVTLRLLNQFSHSFFFFKNPYYFFFPVCLASTFHIRKADMTESYYMISFASYPSNELTI